MKTLLISITVLIIFSGCLQAQTRNDVKIYAYKQPVIGGAPPKTTISENGQPVENNNQRAKVNYLIYMETPQTIRVVPVEIWINGENYSISSTDIETPLEFGSDNMPGQDKATVLVPKTSNKVVQLHIRPIAVSKANPSVKAASQTNNVVLVYKIGSKFYHAVVKDMAIIEPIVLQ